MDAFDYFFDQRVENKSRSLRIGLFELGAISDAYDEQAESAWGCGAGSGRLAVTPDGVLHGCSKLAWGLEGGSVSAPLPLGDHMTGFSRPDNREKLLAHTEGPRSKCHSCELKSRW